MLLKWTADQLAFTDQFCCSSTLFLYLFPNGWTVLSFLLTCCDIFCDFKLKLVKILNYRWVLWINEELVNHSGKCHVTIRSNEPFLNNEEPIRGLSSGYAFRQSSNLHGKTIICCVRVFHGFCHVSWPSTHPYHCLLLSALVIVLIQGNSIPTPTWNNRFLWNDRRVAPMQLKIIHLVRIYHISYPYQ